MIYNLQSLDRTQTDIDIIYKFTAGEIIGINYNIQKPSSANNISAFIYPGHLSMVNLNGGEMGQRRSKVLEELKVKVLEELKAKMVQKDNKENLV